MEALAFMTTPVPLVNSQTLVLPRSKPVEIRPRLCRLVVRAEQTGDSIPSTTNKAESKPSSAALRCALSRRSFLGSVIVGATGLPFLKDIKPALASSYREYVDTLDGYSFSYPSGWVEVRGAGADVFFRDPVNLDENVVVDFSSPSSSKYKSVEDLGTPQQAAHKVQKQKLTEFMSTRLGVRRESNIISANSRVGDDGRLYYDIETNKFLLQPVQGISVHKLPESASGSEILLRCRGFASSNSIRSDLQELISSKKLKSNKLMTTQIDDFQQVDVKSYANTNQLAVMPEDRVVKLEWSRHYLSTLGVENNRLYELRLQAPERVMAQEGTDLRQIMNSFQLVKLVA